MRINIVTNTVLNNFGHPVANPSRGSGELSNIGNQIYAQRYPFPVGA